MGKLIVINKDELYGYADDENNIVIPALYKEAHTFNCGLAMVRNEDYQYAYINEIGEQVIPFGLFNWCDTHFIYGYARAINSNNKWVIINTLGKVVTENEYDKIWAIKPQYISEIKAYIGDKEYILDLSKMLTPCLLIGLKYIKTFSIDDYKVFFKVSKIDVKVNTQTNLLFFVDGKNVGEVAINKIPLNPVISVVSNSYGKLFLLLHEKEDIGKTSFIREPYFPTKDKSNKIYKSKKTSFWDYENEKMQESCDGLLLNYNDGWSQDEIDSGLADAFEDDSSVYDRW